MEKKLRTHLSAPILYVTYRNIKNEIEKVTFYKKCGSY